MSGTKRPRGAEEVYLNIYCMCVYIYMYRTYFRHKTPPKRLGDVSTF